MEFEIQEIEANALEIVKTIIRDYPATRLTKLLKSLDNDERINLLFDNSNLIDHDRQPINTEKELVLTDTVAAKLLNILNRETRRNFWLRTSAAIGATAITGSVVHNLLRGPQNMGQIERNVNEGTLIVGGSVLTPVISIYISTKLIRLQDDLTSKMMHLLCTLFGSLEDKERVAKNYVDTLEPLLKAITKNELELQLSRVQQTSVAR